MGVVEFLIKAKDGVTAPLGKITQSAGKSKSFLNLLNADLKKGTHNIAELQQRIERLKQLREILPADAEKRIREVNTAINTLNNELKRMETINGGKVKTWLSDASSSCCLLNSTP